MVLDRLRRVGKVAVFVLVQVLIVVGLLWVLNQLGAGADERARQATEIAALQAGLEEANARLAEQGEPTIPVPDVEPDGDPVVVPIPPSQAQLIEAVASYCAGGVCRGADGADGDDPSEADVLNAVTQYCADGRCTGVAGISGASGATGATGATGEPGRPPTAEEIAAAVSAYCSTGACTGPAGMDGADGVDGEPGPACPDGWAQQTLTVMIRDDVAPTWREITTCVTAEPTP